MAHPAAPHAQDPIVQGIADLSRRLRILEERYLMIRRKGQLTDENMLRAEEELRSTVEKLSSEVVELRRLLLDIDEKLDRFLEQVKGAATRQDVLVLRKYVDLWDPVRYLTREEALRIIEQERR